MSITRGRRRWNRHLATSEVRLARIYDRLRKRSLRQAQAYDESLRSWDGTTMDDAFEQRLKFYGLKDGCDVAHSAYVRGVVDALAAVEEAAQNG